MEQWYRNMYVYATFPLNFCVFAQEIHFVDLCHKPTEPPNRSSKCLANETRSEVDFVVVSSLVQEIQGKEFVFEQKQEDNPQLLNGEPIFFNDQSQSCAWYSSLKGKNNQNLLEMVHDHN